MISRSRHNILFFSKLFALNNLSPSWYCLLFLVYLVPVIICDYLIPDKIYALISYCLLHFSHLVKYIVVCFLFPSWYDLLILVCSFVSTVISCFWFDTLFIIWAFVFYYLLISAISHLVSGISLRFSYSLCFWHYMITGKIFVSSDDLLF